MGGGGKVKETFLNKVGIVAGFLKLPVVLLNCLLVP